MKQKRVLPAQVFDYLELAALAFGGIGGGYLYDDSDVVPFCVWGYAYGDDGGEPIVVDALNAAQISLGMNDIAVEAVNARRGRDRGARIPFAQWCLELGVVRGE